MLSAWPWGHRFHPRIGLNTTGESLLLARLGDARFTEVWRAGHSLAPEDAVAEGLALARELAAAPSPV